MMRGSGVTDDGYDVKRGYRKDTTNAVEFRQPLRGLRNDGKDLFLEGLHCVVPVSLRDM